MNYLVFGAILLVWVVFLAAVWLKRDQLTGDENGKLMNIALPIGITVFVWMCIFAVVVF